MKQIKIIFLLGVFIVGAQFSKAQTFAPIGTKWTYTLRFFSSPDIDTMCIRSIGDTIIQNKNCKILKKSSEICDLRGFEEYMYSDSGKVFFYDTALAGFQMLYNINADTSDSWLIYLFTPPNSQRDTIKVSVDSVSTITINSTVLKEIFVSYSHYSFSFPNWSPTGFGKIIENMGDTYYLFPWVLSWCDITYGGPLRCYDDSIVGHYETGVVSSCDYRDVTTGIKEESKSTDELNIFPNPFVNSLTVELMNWKETNIDFIEIYNLLGEKTIRSSVTKKSCSINLYNQPAGIYFLKVIVGQNKFYYKVIKE